MAEDLDDPLAAAIALGDAFQRYDVSYAVGGAPAYGYWGIPRATMDVHVNVFVERDGLVPVVEALHSLGIAIDLERALNDSDASGLFVVEFGEFRVDVFTPSIDFAWAAEGTRLGSSLLPISHRLFFSLICGDPSDVRKVGRAFPRSRSGRALRGSQYCGGTSLGS